MPGSVVPQAMFTAYRPELANSTSACFLGGMFSIFSDLDQQKAVASWVLQGRNIVAESFLESLLKGRPAGERTEAPVHKRLQEGTQ